MTTPDHLLSDSREPRDGDPECDHCLKPRSAHIRENGWDWCDHSSGQEFEPLTEQSEREMRASMRGEA